MISARGIRTAFLVPGFPKDESDTSCLPAVQNYVRAFSQLHPDAPIQVVAFQYPFHPGAYRWHGIPVASAGGANRGGWSKLRTWQRAWLELRRFLPDLIHSFWIGECAAVGELFARTHGVAHVATIGGQELRRRTLYARLLSRGKMPLAAGSQTAARTARVSLHRDADVVIPLGLDVAQFGPSDLPRDIDVLAVGSLIPVKRFDVVAGAARKSPERSFVLVGDGPLRAEIAHRAPENLTMAGALSRHDVIDLMRRSKVLLHPSEFESQGYVFLEALASGMHVVCRDVGAPGRSDRVHRCETDGELIEETERVLSGLSGGSDPTFPPADIPTAEDSVRAYAALYERALEEKSKRAGPSARRARAAVLSRNPPRPRR